MLVLGLSSLFGPPGGIPAFNQLLVRAAGEFAAAAGHNLAVVALTDAGGAAPDPRVLPAQAEYRPCRGDRRRFSLEILRRGQRAQRLCLGHVNLAPLGLLWRLRGRGYGVITHGTEVWSRLPPLRWAALRGARAVACVGQYTQRCVESLQGVPGPRCQLLINAVDPRWFDAQALPAPPAEAPAPPLAKAGAVHLLTISRLHPGEPKGIDLVLQALPGLPQARYVVAGEGGDQARLQRLAAALGVAERVRFVGRIGPPERDQLLRACDVFVMPSSGEGFGIVYLEAMAYGKPCLGADVGGVPDVIRDGHTGLLVTPDVAGVAAGLSRLSGDPVLRARLGRAGQDRVRERFVYAQFKEHAHRFFDRL